MACDGCSAGAVQRSKKCSLANNRGRRIGVIDPREQTADARIIFARFDADRALGHRRQKFVGRHDPRGVARQAKPPQTGKGQQCRVGLARIDLAQTRLDIAAQRRHPQIGTPAEGDCLPAQRRRAKACPSRQRLERSCLAADENIPGILALEASSEQQS